MIGRAFSLMNILFRPILFSLGVVFAFGATGASAGQPPTTPAPGKEFAASARLTAALTGDLDITLRWDNVVTPEGGNWLEYATAQDDFIKLAAFTEGKVVSFVHPNLVPGTTFLYRLQPFFGRATEPVAIATGVGLPSDRPLREGPIEPSGDRSADAASQVPLRSNATFSRAVPTDLTATLSSPTSVDLRWKDHASDEDGFLLEIANRRDGQYRACALLPPNVTSFRKTNLADNQRWSFRVRAFFYGAPSEPVSATTKSQGADH